MGPGVNAITIYIDTNTLLRGFYFVLNQGAIMLRDQFKRFKVLFSYLKILLDKIIAARDWSLRYGTNLAQLLNILFCTVFMYIFGFASYAVNNAPIYRAFESFKDSGWWFVMPTIVILQIIFMVVKSLRCDILSGFVLIVSFPVWTFVSIAFANSGYNNTGTYIYGIWAVACLMSGWRMVDLYDYRLIVKRRGRADARCINNRSASTDITSSDVRTSRRPNGSLPDLSKEG